MEQVALQTDHGGVPPQAATTNTSWERWPAIHQLWSQGNWEGPLREDGTGLEFRRKLKDQLCVLDLSQCHCTSSAASKSVLLIV